jgi:hypothetical protein
MTEHYTWRIGFFVPGVAGMLTVIVATQVLPSDHAVLRDKATNLMVEPFGPKILAILKTPTAASLLFKGELS